MKSVETADNTDLDRRPPALQLFKPTRAQKQILLRCDILLFSQHRMNVYLFIYFLNTILYVTQASMFC